MRVCVCVTALYVKELCVKEVCECEREGESCVCVCDAAPGGSIKKNKMHQKKLKCIKKNRNASLKK